MASSSCMASNHQYPKLGAAFVQSKVTTGDPHYRHTDIQNLNVMISYMQEFMNNCSAQLIDIDSSVSVYNLGWLYNAHLLGGQR